MNSFVKIIKYPYFKNYNKIIIFIISFSNIIILYLLWIINIFAKNWRILLTKKHFLKIDLNINYNSFYKIFNFKKFFYIFNIFIY